ncbi:MAG: hypothetical protein R3277_12185 [Brumimicrobium sp.]|nr:hypothetical protein [Brumimicrobium sp.]
MFSSLSNLAVVEEVRRIGANSFVDKIYLEILIDTVIQVYNEDYSYNKFFQADS